MKIIFAGTPEFSVPVLHVLLESAHEVVAVYTQPDRPAGRGRRTKASPVKRLAMEHELPVCQPRTLRDEPTQAALEAYQADLLVVVAYGLILPPAVLAMPRLGCINVHASLLPRWRGAAPIQRAILAGDHKTGVTLMQMDAGLDTGPVLASLACPIAPDDNGGRLHDRLSQLGARLLRENLKRIEQGQLVPQGQDDVLATYAEKLDKREAAIDWTLSAEDIGRKVRAFNPWPVAETRYTDKQFRVWEAIPAFTDDAEQVPGTVLAAGMAGIDVACGTGALRLVTVQLPGARPVSAGDFVNAHTLEGVRFGAG
ncbi:MAG: methionyl-tRNA formyltransferase [Pseudomonadota bacterium]|nr:methionyl-tRNA formyltransferase [Pseudomonadota bacterium]